MSEAILQSSEGVHAAKLQKNSALDGSAKSGQAPPGWEKISDSDAHQKGESLKTEVQQVTSTGRTESVRTAADALEQLGRIDPSEALENVLSESAKSAGETGFAAGTYIGDGLEGAGALLTLINVKSRIAKNKEETQMAAAHLNGKLDAPARDVLKSQPTEKAVIAAETGRAGMVFGAQLTDTTTHIVEASAHGAERSTDALSLAGQVLHVAGGFATGLVSIGLLVKNVVSLVKQTSAYFKIAKASSQVHLAKATQIKKQSVEKIQQKILKQKMKITGLNILKNSLLGSSAGLSLALSFGAAVCAATPIVGWALLGAGILIGVGVGIYSVVQKRKQNALSVQRQGILKTSVEINQAMKVANEIPGLKAIAKPTLDDAKAALATLQTQTKNSEKSGLSDDQMLAVHLQERTLSRLIAHTEGQSGSTLLDDIQKESDKKVLHALNLGIQKNDLRTLVDVAKDHQYLLDSETVFGISLADLATHDSDGKLMKAWLASLG